LKEEDVEQFRAACVRAKKLAGNAKAVCLGASKRFGEAIFTFQLLSLRVNHVPGREGKWRGFAAFRALPFSGHRGGTIAVP
jgi:hypothetical protein